MHNFKPRGLVVGDEDGVFSLFSGAKNINFLRANS
jgi:hypothetical protein